MAGKRKRCPEPACRRMIRLTSAGNFYAHKPYTRQYSGEFVPECAMSGRPPQAFHVKRGDDHEATETTRTEPPDAAE